MFASFQSTEKVQKLILTKMCFEEKMYFLTLQVGSIQFISDSKACVTNTINGFVIGNHNDGEDRHVAVSKLFTFR